MNTPPLKIHDNKNSDIVFVIAAPHSFKDISVKGRSCDENALNAAKAFKHVFDSEFKTIPYVYHVSDTIRSKIDYNRRISRGYKWRKDLDETINYLSHHFNIVIVLETHSFPPNYALFKSDSSVVFLNHPGTYTIAEELKKYFDKLTKNKAILEMTEISKGNTMINDIQLSSVYGLDDNTYRSNVYPVLYEFNEDQTISGPRTLDTLAKKIIEFFVYKFEYLVKEGTVKTDPSFETVINISTPPSITAGGILGAFSGGGIMSGDEKLIKLIFIILGLIIIIMFAALLYKRIIEYRSEKEHMSIIVKPYGDDKKKDKTMIPQFNRAEISNDPNGEKNNDIAIDVPEFKMIHQKINPANLNIRGVDGIYNANSETDPSLLGSGDPHKEPAKRLASELKIVRLPKSCPQGCGKNKGQDTKKWLEMDIPDDSPYWYYKPKEIKKENFTPLYSRTPKPTKWAVKSLFQFNEIKNNPDKVSKLINKSYIIPSSYETVPVSRFGIAIVPPLIGQDIWNVTTLYDTNDITDVDNVPVNKTLL